LDQQRKPRAAIDIGGTFTDVVLETDAARYSAKILTDKIAPERALMEGLRNVLAQAALAPIDVGILIHGTTLATNAIIERRGARTALLTTEGFRDTIEIAFENRFEQYDVFIVKPKPLVPRQWRFTVTERIDATGRVRIPLNEAGVRSLARPLRDEHIESVAVGLLHSYANSSHEQRVRDILVSESPDLHITLSSEVCPELREYERFTTATANAYVQPLIAQYLQRLSTTLASDGFHCPLVLMSSGGGLTTVETALRFPIRLVESGPAGGAIFAITIAEKLKLSRVVSFDMGGTTAKICLIDDAKPMLSRTFEVDRQYKFQKGSGLPIRIPVIEMLEIGAGGGSIASVDSMRRVAVGPASAGSDPGPASYSRGGVDATVTDASVALGHIYPEGFAGGAIQLAPERGEEAIRRMVAAPLGVDIRMAAYAINEMVDENMANAARVHAMERGSDLSGRVMIAFGGSAPLHAARVAEKLQIQEILIPAHAGVGSAIGFLRAPVSFEAVRTRLLKLSEIDCDQLRETIRDMIDEATSVVRLGAAYSPLSISCKAEMRYVGQGHEIAVLFEADDLLGNAAQILRARFEARYKDLFGRTVPNLEVEVTTWTVLVAADIAVRGPPPAIRTGLDRPRAASKRRCFDPLTGDLLEVPAYDRRAVPAGTSIKGPALIVDPDTTTVVTPDFSASIDQDGSVRLRRIDITQETCN
jgi:N-methylhydantoinase A/oxoprolinase/acetone carboxylase beta subunit